MKTIAVTAAVLIAAVGCTAAPTTPSYENCDAARAAGPTPLYQGQPGYAPHLDRDGDGIACE